MLRIVRRGQKWFTFFLGIRIFCFREREERGRPYHYVKCDQALQKKTTIPECLCKSLAQKALQLDIGDLFIVSINVNRFQPFIEHSQSHIYRAI